MSKTTDDAEVRVDLPRSGLGEGLRARLAEHGLQAKLVDEGENCALHVRYADDERERLQRDVVHTIEGWLGEQTTPLVVQRAHGDVVVRPPGD